MGKNLVKRGLAWLMAGAITAGLLSGAGMIPKAQAADSGYIADSDLTATGTPAPEADAVVPDANQYWYQKAELSAFCHFGPNTFNEIEWGENYGNKTPDEIFKLEEDFDADTMVRTLKNAGFQMLIVTAKHHDGFCIWNSAYTDYDVAATSYKDGQGDILAELSAACTKYGMDMGLYLSPWDIHDPSYGYYDANGNATSKENDVLDYNDYYNNQLNEILGNPIYGNAGRFREVWMDGAKGSGANAQEYDFERWFETIQSHEGKAAGFDADCMLFGAEAYTTVRWIGNENGYAHENTWSKSQVDKSANTINSNSQGGYTIGLENGNQWTVPEADARITSGWFWGTTKNTPKTIAALADMYFRSVGHNATFLLNVPPNNVGTVDQAILDRVTEFGQNVQETFKKNLATSVQATNVRGNDVAYKPGNTIDGNDATYWTTEDGTNEGTLLIDLGGVKSFDVVSVEEAIQNGQRINSYKVEYRDASGEWHEMQSGQTIGAKRLVRTGAVRGDQVRITVSTSWFVPKPHTAFQWEAQITREEYQRRVDLLRDALKRDKSITYNWHDPETSYLEAVFSRGDRRLADVLEYAWLHGAKMDSWSEYFDFQRWMDALKACGVDGDFYAHRERPRDEVFPWCRIDPMVTPAFLWRERERAYEAVITPDCRVQCTGCGANKLYPGGKCDA